MQKRQTLSGQLLAPASPFLKWAGGKTQLLAELERQAPPEFERYFEPFLGGGALFFRLASRLRFTAFLSDANRDLVNAYSVVKGDVGGLVRRLQAHEGNYKKSPEAFYYRLRSSSPSGSVGMAARLIALNKTCYNGLYRVNRSGLFNVPIGRYKNPTICNAGHLKKASDALNGTRARITACDYKEALSRAREGDFVYLDPPFHPLSSTANFVDYTRDGFGEKDQGELARVFRDLDKKGCKVLLSNSDTDLTRDLYSGFSLKIVRVARAISCKASTRAGYNELLVRNYHHHQQQ